MALETETLAALARDLGAVQVRARGDKVQCSCLLARWTHFGGRDEKPSMVLFPSGKRDEAIYSCLGCHERGPVRDLVLHHMSAGGSRGLLKWIEVLDGESTEAPTKLSERLKALPEMGKWSNEKKKAPMQEREIVKTFNDGKPWYDYKALAQADEVTEISWGAYAEFAGKIPRYALQRGLTVETCKEWDLGHDKTMRRLLFPIKDRKGRLVGISGRLYSQTCVYCDGPIARDEVDENGKKIRAYCKRCDRNEPPKYLHSDEFKRNLVLYGEHRRQDNIDGNVYVVEGHLDMLKMWQSGYRPVVAMLGSYPGGCQIEKLIAYWGRRITIVPDGDKAGADMAAKIRSLVADRVQVSTKKLPDKMDPGDLTQEQMSEIIGPPPIDSTLLTV